MNNNTVDTIETIEKEQIEHFRFPEMEVLFSEEKIEHRLYEATRAMKLGNNFNDKVKIVFEDTEGIKMVETTVWGLTDARMLLKGGIAIPLCRIHEVII